MSKYCNEMYCSQEYGYTLEMDEIWCETCGKIEATKEDLKEYTPEEFKELGLDYDELINRKNNSS